MKKYVCPRCVLSVRLICLAFLVFSLRCPAAEPVMVNIEGLSEPLEKNVRALLTIVRETADASPERMRLVQDRAPDEIGRALEPFGYYRPKVAASLSRRDGNWVAAYRIDPGLPIRLADVDVRISGEAANLPDMRVLADRFPLKQGDILDHALYEKGKDALQDRAAEFGFFDAQLTRREIRVDLKAYRAEIHLRLDSGQRYRFGPVSFNETPLEPGLLRRFVHFAPGEPYRASAVLDLQKSFLNSGYFAKADIDPQPEHAQDREIPIRVDLGMQPRNRFEAGVGYGTDTGPRVSLGYRNRYVNRYGHSFQASARLSFIWNELDAIYAIPLERPDRDQLAFTARSGLEDTVAGEAKVIRAGVRHSTVRWSLRELLALDFHRETFKIAGETQTTLLLMPSATYTWLDADDPIYPRRGIRIDGNVGGAWDGVVSDVSFARVRFNAKGVYSLNDRNRLIARGQLGLIVTDGFNRLPLTQRFYAGGDQSVRGYRLNEISPEDKNGDRIGGRHLLVGSLEYERVLFGDWGLAVFSDVGHVFNRIGEPFRIGVGVGVRWRSPVGPVRLDFGVPLSKAEDAFQVHVVLGPDL
jgi:translocation and assembly module TamA